MMDHSMSRPSGRSMYASAIYKYNHPAGSVKQL